MELDKLTQPGWDDAADYFHERDETYGTSELIVLALVQQQIVNDTLPLAPTIFGDRRECLEILSGIAPMPQGKSPPGSRHRRLGSMKLQSNRSISGLETAAELDMSHLLKATRDEPGSFFPPI
jgi:hypothetical protein